jgi:hypothetical protein
VTQASKVRNPIYTVGSLDIEIQYITREDTVLYTVQYTVYQLLFTPGPPVAPLFSLTKKGGEEVQT